MIHLKQYCITDARLNTRGGDLTKRWYIDYKVNGHKFREWIPSNPAENRADRAKERLSEVKLGVDIHMPAPLPSIPEKSHFDKFRQIIDSHPKWSPKTKCGYRTALKDFSDYFKGVDITEIKSGKAIKFQDYLSKSLSEKTVKNKINNIKAIFSLTKYNPLKGVTATIVDDDSDFNYPYNEFEKASIEEYLKEHNPRLYLFTRFIFYAFLRPKEIIGLEVRDIDIRNKTIRIRKEISKNRRAAIVPLVKPLYDLILKEKVLQYPSHFKIFGYNLKTGECPSQTNIASAQHKIALVELGLYRERETVLYSWKHTGNCMAYMAGMDIRLIQTINRHKSLQTTEIYLRKLGIFLNKQAFEIEY